MKNKKGYLTAPVPTPGMPSGIPYIVGNEAAERFSFYGMKGILTIFMLRYLWLMNEEPGTPMSKAQASEYQHLFTSLVYLTPLLGALIADIFFGKYRTIVWLSLIYCLGHGALALMGVTGAAALWLVAGLGLICLGSGGIKPCVSAHVGDQFGKSNSHLLTRVFNYFYWSINLGAFLSHLLTPWLLEWYGPHLAFGIPGILMALATLVFWMGRRKFIHVPAGGFAYIKELFSRKGIVSILKLFIIYIFVAIFWALFDQTASSWIIQAEDMNRNWLGIEWLPSQIQLLNPVLILCFIPLFTFVLYPAINRIFRLTPLRKISIGLFLMVVAFSISAIIQERIDGGAAPSFGWQALAYAFLTASEVMVSIVCLEFSYTQASPRLKSSIMALFLLSVSLGNLFTAGVNHFIQIPTPIVAQTKEGFPAGETRLAGLDEKAGTLDDIIVSHDEEGKRTDLQFGGKAELSQAVTRIKAAIEANEFAALSNEKGQEIASTFKDPWGNSFRYTTVNRKQCRVISDGPDKTAKTQWDIGATIDIAIPAPPAKETAWTRSLAKLRPETPWLERRKKELGLPTQEEIDKAGRTVSESYFVGGQTKLEGAPYFWFFAKLMLGAAILFVFVAWLYKPQDYLHEEAEQ